MGENVIFFFMCITRISLNTMVYSHIHSSMDDVILFFMVEQNSIEDNNTFSSSVLLWHLGCIHILAIVIEAAVNMSV